MSGNQLVANFTANTGNAVSGITTLEKKFSGLGKKVVEEYKLMSDAQEKLRQQMSKAISTPIPGSTDRKFATGESNLVQLDDYIAKAKKRAEQMRIIKADIQKAADMDYYDTNYAGGKWGVGGGKGSKKGEGKHNQGVQGILELSRGLEDAAISYQLNGISGAIRGATNNISQFAMIMGGPVTGAIAGFAAAGVSVLMPFMQDWIDSLDTVKKRSEETAEIFKTMISAAGDAAAQRQQLMDLDSPEKAKSQLDNQEKELAGLKASEGQARELLMLAQKSRKVEVETQRQERNALKDATSPLALLNPLEATDLARKALAPGRAPGTTAEDVTARAVALNTETKAREVAEAKIVATRKRLGELQEKDMFEQQVDSDKARNFLHKKEVKDFEEQQEASNQAANFLADKEDQKIKTLAGTIQTGMEKSGDMTLSASVSGTTAETSAIARASRMKSAEPTQDEIKKAVELALKEHQKHTVQNANIITAIKAQVAVVGVTF